MALHLSGRPTILAALGVTGPVIVLVSVLASVAASPWFDFRAHALSDLGNFDVAWLFNGGLISGGFLGTLFAIGYLISLEPKRRLGAVGSIILAGSMVSLSMIGIFPSGGEGPHLFFSFAFFILLLVALLILGIYLSKFGGCWTRGIPLVVTAVWGALVWAIPWGGGIAMPEALSALPGLLAVAYLAINVLRPPMCSAGSGRKVTQGRKD